MAIMENPIKGREKWNGWFDFMDFVLSGGLVVCKEGCVSFFSIRRGFWINSVCDQKKRLWKN